MWPAMTCQLMDELLPHGRLLSPVEAEKHLGISASTVRTWHHRRQRTGLYSAGVDRYGRPLFYEADLIALKLRLRVRDKQGQRHHTMHQVMARVDQVAHSVRR